MASDIYVYYINSLSNQIGRYNKDQSPYLRYRTIKEQLYCHIPKQTLRDAIKMRTKRLNAKKS